MHTFACTCAADQWAGEPILGPRPTILPLLPGGFLTPAVPLTPLSGLSLPDLLGITTDERFCLFVPLGHLSLVFRRPPPTTTTSSVGGVPRSHQLTTVHV